MLIDRRPALRRLLDAYRPEDSAEQGHRQAILQLLESTQDPFSRHHFAPGHVTASAFVLAPDLEQILLILHGKLHRWLQPGGHVDPDDADVIAAARREVAEEVGLRELAFWRQTAAIFDVDVHVIPARRTEPEHRHFDVRFAFVAPGHAFVAASDARAGQWVPLREVGRLESDASVLRAVAKLRRP